MASAAKRHRIISLLKLYFIDVILLQETHFIAIESARALEVEWGGTGFWSLGSYRSKGVGILVRPGLRYNCYYNLSDHEGRLLVVDIKFGDLDARIINVYAPNNHRERRLFFQSVETHINTTQHAVIIAGDFNCVENTALDRSNQEGSYRRLRAETPYLIDMGFLH